MLQQRILFFTRIKTCLTASIRRASTWPEWSIPDGYDTGIMVYNTRSKSKVPLVTRVKGHVSWYMCGPTVYDTTHIGHGLCYVRFDIVRRLMRDYFNLNVFQVMGVTDIDDKIINRANKESVDISTISRFYEDEFFECLSRLGVMKPNLALRVTDHIQQIIKFIEKILENGMAYQTDDGSVFFDNVAYSQKRGLPLPEDLETAENDFNVSTYSSLFKKRHPIDFALWKASKKGEPYWDSSFGPGRPGWHIECSSMASSLFGSHLDVHGGGKDLLFPHHYCEEAQSCVGHSTDIWGNYWFHAGMLLIGTKEDKRKMSKSYGNVMSVTELLNKHSANTFRHFALTTHYTNDVVFGETTLTVAAAEVHTIEEFLNTALHFIGRDLSQGTPQENCSHPLSLKLQQTVASVDRHFRDDFNTSSAMKDILSLISLTNSYIHGAQKEGVEPHHVRPVRAFVLSTMNTLGMNYQRQETDSLLPEVLDLLTSFRHKIRQDALSVTKKQLSGLSESERKWRLERKGELLTHCDELRDNLQQLSIAIKDIKDGSMWGITNAISKRGEEETEPPHSKSSPESPPK